MTFYFPRSKITSTKVLTIGNMAELYEVEETSSTYADHDSMPELVDRSRSESWSDPRLELLIFEQELSPNELTPDMRQILIKARIGYSFYTERMFPSVEEFDEILEKGRSHLVLQISVNGRLAFQDYVDYKMKPIDTQMFRCIADVKPDDVITITAEITKRVPVGSEEVMKALIEMRKVSKNISLLIGTFVGRIKPIEWVIPLSLTYHKI